MFGGPGIAHCRQNELRAGSALCARARSRVGRRGLPHRQIAAHRDALRIAFLDESSGRTELGREIPAAEEADGHARSARAVDLASAERFEERLARVLLGPDRGEAAEVVAGTRHAGVEGVGLPFGGGARGAGVDVGRGDLTEGVGVHADSVRLSQAFDQRITGEVESRFAALASERPPTLSGLAIGGFVEGAVLLEIAVLVGAHHFPEARAALRFALDLHHLGDGLHACPQRRITRLVLERRALGILDREDLAVAEVWIVGDGEDVAAGDALLAISLEGLPEAQGIGLVGGGDGLCRDLFVPEDHVAVDLRQVGRIRVLVGDEGREAAGGRLVVEFCGGALDVLPGGEGGLTAQRAVLATERLRSQARDAPSDLAGGLADRGPRERAAVVGADGVQVEGMLGIGTGFDAAQCLGMVRDGGEVERAVDPEGEAGPAFFVQGADLDLLAAGEAVGVAGALAGIEHIGVHRVGGVDVEVAPVDVSLGVVVVATLALRLRERRDADEGHGDECE